MDPAGAHLRVEVDDRLRSLGVQVYCRLVERVEVRPTSPGLEAEIRRIEEEVRREVGAPERLREHPMAKAYRSFLWRLSIDPTKTRPSSEALVRRILRRGSMPRINNVVDAGNAASAATLVPIGLYDADRVGFPLRLTLSTPGMVFEPVGSDRRLELGGGIPVLLDSNGVVMHIYPHRDSRATMIRDDTRRVLAIAAGVGGVSFEALVKALDLFIRLLRADGLTPHIVGECST